MTIWTAPAMPRSVFLCFVLSACCFATAQGKSEPPKPSLTGHYEGIAKNKAEDVIPVAIDLTEKDGTFSGIIHSSHGDFTITGGSRKGDTITIEFDAGGEGTMSLQQAGEKLTGTWTAGEDGGPLDVKKVAAPEDGAKSK